MRRSKAVEESGSLMMGRQSFGAPSIPPRSNAKSSPIRIQKGFSPTPTWNSRARFSTSTCWEKPRRLRARRATQLATTLLRWLGERRDPPPPERRGHASSGWQRDCDGNNGPITALGICRVWTIEWRMMPAACGIFLTPLFLPTLILLTHRHALGGCSCYPPK